MSYKMVGISRAAESFSRWTLLHRVGRSVGWFNLVNKANLVHNFS